MTIIMSVMMAVKKVVKMMTFKKRDGGAEDELEDRGGESQGGLHPKVGHDDQHEHVHKVDCEQGRPTGMGQGFR